MDNDLYCKLENLLKFYERREKALQECIIKYGKDDKLFFGQLADTQRKIQLVNDLLFLESKTVNDL